jgi:DNA adenine methylase
MKYMGSKRRIADEIIEVMLSVYNGCTFVDAFCGGCHVIEKVPTSFRRIANDKNVYLIEMWKALTNGETFQQRIPKTLYDEVRDDWYKPTNEQQYNKAYIGWVGWMASCKGRFFDGGYSSHEASDGRDYINEQIRGTLKQVPNLIGVEFQSVSYENLVVPENSLIYCDIPYKGTKQYATSKDFDYEKFYDWCKMMASKGHKVFISEYTMPEENFDCVWSKETKNSMSLKNTYQIIEKLWVPK